MFCVGYKFFDINARGFLHEFTFSFTWQVLRFNVET